MLVIFLSVLFISHVSCLYPQNALKCYSSLTRPDNQLICPQGRDVYCVKEVSSLKKDLCGKTQYFGDTMVGELCEFKKCSDKCVEGQYEFIFGGTVYTRNRFCCNDANYCNSSFKNSKFAYSLLILVLLITFYNILYY